MAPKKTWTEQLHTSFPGRLNFANIDKPGSVKKKDGSENPPKYRATLIQKINPHTDKLIAECEDMGLAYFGEAWKTSENARRPYMTGEKVLADYAAKLAKEGEGKKPSDQMVKLYSDKIQIQASGNPEKAAPRCYVVMPGEPKARELYRRPGVMEDLKAIEEQFYNGCWCTIAVKGFIYEQSKTSWGISLCLFAIKFMRDGERLGAVDIDEAFGGAEDVPEDAYMDEIDSAMSDEHPDTNI